MMLSHTKAKSDETGHGMSAQCEDLRSFRKAVSDQQRSLRQGVHEWQCAKSGKASTFRCNDFLVQEKACAVAVRERSECAPCRLDGPRVLIKPAPKTYVPKFWLFEFEHV